ncbi:hypothetical protein QUB16_18750, partial [Microcoleus sp. D3_18a_C4]
MSSIFLQNVWKRQWRLSRNTVQLRKIVAKMLGFYFEKKICRGGFHKQSSSIIHNLVNPPPPNGKSIYTFGGWDEIKVHVGYWWGGAGLFRLFV